MTKWLAMALTIAAITTNTASATPSDTYPTLDEAAVAALAYVDTLPWNNRREYIGLVYEVSGSYKFTEPQSENSRYSTRGAFTIPKGSGRGIFHNHPRKGGRGNDKLQKQFSPEDVQMATKLGLISYISVDAKVKKFDPSKPDQEAEEVALAAQ